ncbi:multifunctional oxoglutarate decarboxylase/oxoglutarate dehydrogenase thiamine pyrophosphate-binding subunit/dihydrolipoyllysine-residue succinyltransferase subunit [Demequina sp. SYSU T00192]|uniref:Multifunctional oxoglutarate decarboxylase/oxoglutarate dehydrogenase thiamine pyrophosphate-binding subunit/dihydrolipoyllysine-residue succinyltransferase subunit n=1 Tax=Demequina litoralis TaxID=3051660 RepID=A0ABT8G798_9MICO|nr:multifunctional oxoglutarate decarboxylase/oxoglutarate dehydrogenase thiamine pyrophosphate-binding subunit/dihydrolipoyllysine-residue succinyltransferase subunit [Demequina sp. SYSU T00192]MDN4474877.1 multifunctional oxoglutarate decarboxylase/oxoglutarate dehydrogenase thiamine pyrophosphate-binding subunit/dihydrolipoyllysine-residue succinyltransferase subunit [Demequina sp. SYSU T00192]
MSPDTSAPDTDRVSVARAAGAPSVASLILGGEHGADATPGDSSTRQETPGTGQSSIPQPPTQPMPTVSAAAVPPPPPPPPPAQRADAPAPTTRPAADTPSPAAAEPAASVPAVPAAPAAASSDEADPTATQPIATAQAPTAAYLQRPEFTPVATKDVQQGVERLRGPAARVVQNMEASLAVPTATSVRTVPAKLLMDNRVVVNNHLARTRGGKVSFTHLIGFAIVESLAEFPAMNAAYTEEDGKPAVRTPASVNLGLAIDLARPDGSRQLLVPSIKGADRMDFAEFWSAYEDVVRRARNGALQAADFQGTTLTLTNPGTLGTVHSVPRLMDGQGAIIGVGSMDYPAEFLGAAEETVARLGVSKVMTVTSTYDHRVIQGAQSGEFLGIVHRKLLGLDGFYDRVFSSMRVPYEPVRWIQDTTTDPAIEAAKPARIAELIHAYRSRGHLMADVDPLSSRPRKHPDLDVQTHGLTLWDLDRTYETGGFAGQGSWKMRTVLSRLRDAYCRTIGLEYMHIADREQRSFFQDRLEHGYTKPTREEHLRILHRLNAAEAFEAFLQTKFVGQKRFSLEGGESLIPLLDSVMSAAAESGVHEVCIGMAHRGRLNVLANLAGKSYGQIFSEFEGTAVPGSVQGSGDVKYHLGTEGTFTAESGATTRVYLAANPSHLEAVDPVLEGIVRAKLDALGADPATDGYPVLPVLVHGDAAFAGQGVVLETLNMALLKGYRTGGTVHVIINNQVGFTTGPESSRSTRYCTDIAKGFQIPIFHVNGDDPEACVRAARLAFEYRERFGRDVIVDMVCYRRRGHNEGDDPSMTQPRMYDLIEGKRSVRHLYTEALIRRGDITTEEAESVSKDYLAQLERVFIETREGYKPASDAESISGLELPSSQSSDAGVMVGWKTSVSASQIERIGRAHVRPPEGFSVHPKLEKLLERRETMSREGGIDWGYGEILAFGTLLQEGVPVRVSGQDSRRGTFVQRHAVYHDRNTGSEWTPLLYLSSDQGRLHIFDSPLSEYGVLGFEYGYSVERPDALVLWEAQFGDFVNGAQTIIDEFISSAEQKWGQSSSVVLLLPHGFEGQGPDHSSARVERFLQMCGEENMIAAMPSTPASYFHLLRRQAYNRPRKPLVVFTPKSMLRLRAAQSSVEDFTTGTFREVIGDDAVDPASVDRVLLCAGKVYYDLVAERDRTGDTTTAIVRLEQLYPLAHDAIREALAPFDGAELMWVQEEPLNQGAWSRMSLSLPQVVGTTVGVVSRPASASPASGLASRHAAEQSELVTRAFTR